MFTVKEAFKMMIDDKKVICSNGFVFERHTRNISKKKGNKHVKYLGYEDFILEEYHSLFKEYIKPKPRKFEFEAYIGECPNKKMIFDNSCTDHAFGYYTSNMQHTKTSLLDNYKVISKFKITMEEILE